MTRPAVDRLFLARHGETEWNRAGRRQGRLDSPLTEQGSAQVQEVAIAVAPLPIDAVFSSPLQRAATTAAVIADVLGLRAVVIEDLQEIDHGDWSGLTNAQIEVLYAGERTARLADLYLWKFPNGESYADGDRRAARAVRQILRSGFRYPLVVSHEMIGRMLLRNLLTLDPFEALAWNHPHDLVYEVNVDLLQVVELRVGE